MFWIVLDGESGEDAIINGVASQLVKLRGLEKWLGFSERGAKAGGQSRAVANKVRFCATKCHVLPRPVRQFLLPRCCQDTPYQEHLGAPSVTPNHRILVRIGPLGYAQVGPEQNYESVGRVSETRWAHHSDHSLGPPLALRSFPLADASMGPDSPRPGSEADLGRCGTP